MYVGADYYPEHWPRARWETDARLMAEAGFNVVRLAEFAWVNLEPQEGVFDFAWLDDALAVLHKHGVKALLCTPTAVMPAWLARKYPESLATRFDGSRVEWGTRKNNCFTAGAYRLLSERITQAMADHFADAPNVIGWQTDNEFSGSASYFCHCATCRASFQEWLRARHGDLETLNARLGMHFWGHHYKTWAEIRIPEKHTAGFNPSLSLEFLRFTTHLNVQFQRDQVRILRARCPNHFVTHNLMGFAAALNYYELAEDLDFVSWDNYPLHNEHDTPYGAAAAADLMRGMKGKNFWIMEQTAGPCGAQSFGRNPRPGEIRRIAYQQLAHGADGQVWFRWRTCTAGREQYWHGLLGHDGEPLRRYREAAQTAREYHRLWEVLDGTTVRSQVAMLYDYDSIWASQIQPGFSQNDYKNRIRRFYEPLWRAGVNVDFVPPAADFSPYRVLIAPNLHVLPDALAGRIEAFVRAGGVFVTDCRTAVKDEWNLCHDRTLPGLLSDCLGIRIEEYESLEHPGGSSEFAIEGQGALQGDFTAHLYADWVQPGTAEVLATYKTQWHLADYAAATRHPCGQGGAYYVGTLVQEGAFYDQLLGAALAQAGVEPVVAEKPEWVEATVREGDGKAVLFLINHADAEATVPVPAGKTELISGETTGDALALTRHGVAAIQLR